MSYQSYGHSGNNAMIAKYRKLVQQQLQDSRRELGDQTSGFSQSKTVDDLIERRDDKGVIHTDSDFISSSPRDDLALPRDVLSSSTDSRLSQQDRHRDEFKTRDESQSKQTFMNGSKFGTRSESRLKETFSLNVDDKVDLNSDVHGAGLVQPKTLSALHLYSTDSSKQSPVSDNVCSPNHPISQKLSNPGVDSLPGNKDLLSSSDSSSQHPVIHPQYNSQKISFNKMESGSKYSSDSNLQEISGHRTHNGSNGDLRNKYVHLAGYRRASADVHDRNRPSSADVHDRNSSSSNSRSYSHQFNKVESRSQNGSNSGSLKVEDLSPIYPSNSDLRSRTDSSTHYVSNRGSQNRTLPISQNGSSSNPQINTNSSPEHRLNSAPFIYPAYGSKTFAQNRTEHSSHYGPHNDTNSGSMVASHDRATQDASSSQISQNEHLPDKTTECTERVSRGYVEVDFPSSTCQQNSSIVSDDYGDDYKNHRDDKRDIKGENKPVYSPRELTTTEPSSVRPGKPLNSKPSGFPLVSGYDRHSSQTGGTRFSQQTRQFIDDRQQYGDSRHRLINHTTNSDLESELTDRSDRYENGVSDYRSDTDAPRRVHHRHTREDFEEPIYHHEDDAYLGRSLLTTHPRKTTLSREQLETLSNELRSEKEILAREVVMLRESLESSINTYTPNSPLKRKISELENQIDELQESNEAANLKLYEAEQRISQLSQENNQLHSLSEENDMLKQKILDLETKVVMQNSRPVPNFRQPPRYETIYNTQPRIEDNENRWRDRQHSSLVDERKYSDQFSSSLNDVDLDLSDDGTECLLSNNVLHTVPLESSIVDLPPCQSSSRQSRARQPVRRDVQRDQYIFKRRSRSLENIDRATDDQSWKPLSNLSMNEQSDSSMKKERISSYLSQSAGFRSVSPPPINTQRNRSLSSTAQRSALRSITAGLKPFVIQSASDIQEGDVVKFSRQGGKISQGWVRYVGHLHGRGEVYLGVELDKEEGKHDGVFEGVRYFQCKANKGVFVSFNKVVMAWCLPDVEDRSLTGTPFISTSPRGTSSVIKA